MTARRSLAVALTAVLAAVAVLAGALAAVASMKASRSHAVDHARTAALTAGTASLPKVLSYNYRHLAADFAEAEAQLTPRFRKQYDDTTAKAVQPLAKQVHATVTAAITGAGVVSATARKVVVLFFVSQTVTNSNLDQPRLDRSRINVTLVRAGDRWLIDALSPL